METDLIITPIGPKVVPILGLEPRRVVKIETTDGKVSSFFTLRDLLVALNADDDVSVVVNSVRLGTLT